MAYADKFRHFKPFHERCGWDNTPPPKHSIAAQEESLGIKRSIPSVLTSPSYFDYAGAMQTMLLTPSHDRVKQLHRRLEFAELLSEVVNYYPNFLAVDIRGSLETLNNDIKHAGNDKTPSSKKLDPHTSAALVDADMLQAYCLVEEKVMPVLIAEKARDEHGPQPGTPYPDYARMLKTCILASSVPTEIREQQVASILQSLQQLELPEIPRRQLGSVAYTFEQTKDASAVYQFVERMVMPEIRGQRALQIDGEKGHPMIADHRSGGIS